MADLKQAMIWMAEGKKVRISTWKKGCYNYLEFTGIKAPSNSQVCLTQSSGWEIYEEDEKDPPIDVAQEDADYIVWDTEGHRTFAYYFEGEFRELHGVSAFPLKVDKYKLLPKRKDA